MTAAGMQLHDEWSAAAGDDDQRSFACLIAKRLTLTVSERQCASMVTVASHGNTERMCAAAVAAARRQWEHGLV